MTDPMNPRLLFPFALLVACGTSPTQVLESTTTQIPAAGGIAKSADGLFSARFEAETLAAAAEVQILTESTALEGAVSRVYRVTISELALRAGSNVRLEYNGAGLAKGTGFAIARIPAGGDLIRLSSDHDEVAGTIKSVLGAFKEERFCVTEVLRPVLPLFQQCCLEAGQRAGAGVCESTFDREARIVRGDPCPEAIEGITVSCGDDLACLPQPIDGWDMPPAAGKSYVINDLWIEGLNVGFNLDGSCSPDGSCVDNYLWRLGELGNDQLRQGLQGGALFTLVELSGLPQPYFGYDESTTMKTYVAQDADDPYFPANNFKVPPGHTTCCEFLIAPESLTGLPPQGRNRVPGRIEQSRFRSQAGVSIQLVLPHGEFPHPTVRLERAQISARITATLDEITEGMIGAGLSIPSLAQTINPYCKTVSPRCPVQFTESTLLDLVSTLLGPQPDLDLDGDGHECVVDTDGNGSIDLCCDGAGPGVQSPCGTVCAPGAETVQSIQPGPENAWKCAFAPQMADAYSISFGFKAVSAKIVGVAD